MIRRYLQLHWRGQLPLAKAFWYNYVIINALFACIYVVLYHGMVQLPTASEGWSLLGFGLLLMTAVCWQSVGLIRCAIEYCKVKSNWLFPLGVCSLLIISDGRLFYFSVSSGIAVVVDLQYIIRGDPQWPKPDIEVLPNGKEVEFSGIIKTGAAEEFERVCKKHPELRVVHLNTPGGRIPEAIVMADVVRRYSLDTYVDQSCSSVGIVVFLAGKERSMRDDAHIGFHRWKGGDAVMRSASDLETEVLGRAGADTAFMQRVVDTPADSIWFPTPAELLTQGLVTNVTDGKVFSANEDEIRENTYGGLRSKLLREPVFTALAKRVPAQFDYIVRHMSEEIIRGESVREAMMGIDNLLQDTITQCYESASDSALDLCLKLNIALINRNKYEDPKNTLLVFALRARKSILKGYPWDVDSQYRTALLESRAMAPRVLDVETARAAFRELVSNLSLTHYMQADLAEVPDDRAEAIECCERWERILEGVAEMPAGKRYAVIQLLFFKRPALR